MDNKNSIKFDGKGDYLKMPDKKDWELPNGDITIKIPKKEMYPPKVKGKTEVCYCCHQEKEGTVIIVDLAVTGTGENKVTVTEARFICHSCNHLE